MSQKKSQDIANSTHLNATARTWLELSDEERIFKLHGERWIRYDRAKEVIDKLDKLIIYPKKQRMPNLLIVGDTNNGKTMIVNRFKEQHPPDDNPDGDAKIIPVIIVQAPPTADEGRFYNHILTQLNAPFKENDRPGKKYIQVITICQGGDSLITNEGIIPPNYDDSNITPFDEMEELAYDATSLHG
jgi:hypothetical protein